MYAQILACIDLEDEAESAAVMAAAMKQAKESDGKVTVASVVPEFGFSLVGGYFPDDFEAKMRAAAKEKLDAFADANGGAAIDRWVGHGSIQRETLKAASEIAADLIVIGAGGHELAEQIIGSHASRIVASAACSVLVVRS